MIIKKDRDVPIRKNIGRIFRTYNIFEYKSPEDYLSIDDYYKVYGYACFYKSDTGLSDEIKAKEITITFVTRGYPYKVIKHLEKELHCPVKKQEDGIYYADGQYFPIQFLVTSRLKDEENFWLHHLDHRLKSGKEARELLREYEKNKDNNLYQSVMDLIVRANQKIFKEESVVCEALMEIIQGKYELELEAREEIGEINKLKELIGKKLQKGKSIEQIANELEETAETIEKMIREMTLPADGSERK